MGVCQLVQMQPLLRVTEEEERRRFKPRNPRTRSLDFSST
jgi:hypothetical protein